MIWIKLGCLMGFLAVSFGAFGAHFVKKNLSEYSLTIFNVAAQYKMYHALALILLGLSSYNERFNQKLINLSGICFLIGILLFSVTLFILALLPQQKWLGAITPFGGLLFLVAWILFGLAITK